MDLAAYVAALRICAAPDDALPLLATPPPGVASVALDNGARVAVLTAEPGALATAFGALGTAVAAPPVPSSRGALPVALYPAGPPATVAVYGEPLVYAVAVRWPATGPVGDLRLDPATGALAVARRVAAPGMTRYAADVLGGTWRDMRSGWAWLDVQHEVPGSGTWFVSLSFEADALVAASLAYLAGGEPRDWAYWTAERERDAVQRHDSWLDATLGRVRPWEDGPRFPWGTVWSGYDERSGGSSIVLRYA